MRAIILGTALAAAMLCTANADNFQVDTSGPTPHIQTPSFDPRPAPAPAQSSSTNGSHVQDNAKKSFNGGK